MESMLMHEIIPDLWLGSLMAAINSKLLKARGINIILTIMDSPLRGYYSDAVYHYVCLADSPSEDILAILPNCLSVIENGLLEKQRILVHCAAGVSRSASVVIAYLMWKQKMTRDMAFTFVSKRRSFIGPNPGFMNQLLQFEGMMNRFKIPLLAMNSQAPTSSAPDSIVFSDPIQSQESPMAVCYVSSSGNEANTIMAAVASEETSTSVTKTTTPTDTTPENECSSDSPVVSSGDESMTGSDYLCRKCRQFLFHSCELRQHYVQPTANFISQNKVKQSSSNINVVDLTKCEDLENVLNRPKCTSGELFVEESHWENDSGQCLTMDGKIHCPKCKCKIGSFSWMGEPCVCGTWVVPAFHISRQKCDRVRTLKLMGVQTTVAPS